MHICTSQINLPQVRLTNRGQVGWQCDVVCNLQPWEKHSQNSPLESKLKEIKNKIIHFNPLNMASKSSFRFCHWGWSLRCISGALLGYNIIFLNYFSDGNMYWWFDSLKKNVEYRRLEIFVIM